MLFVYVFGNLNQLVPIVSDTVAHLFFKEKHVATVHFENGRYHLHLEVKKISDNTAESKSNPTKHQDKTELSAHLLCDSFKLEQLYFEHKKQFVKYNKLITLFPSLPTSPPPKQIS